LNFSNRIHRNFCATQAASKGQRHAELRRKICKLWRWRVDYSREKILTAASRITRGRLGARRKSYRPLAVKGARGPFEGRDTCRYCDRVLHFSYSLLFFWQKIPQFPPKSQAASTYRSATSKQSDSNTPGIRWLRGQTALAGRKQTRASSASSWCFRERALHVRSEQGSAANTVGGAGVGQRYQQVSLNASVTGSTANAAIPFPSGIIEIWDSLNGATARGAESHARCRDCRGAWNACKALAGIAHLARALQGRHELDSR